MKRAGEIPDGNWEANPSFSLMNVIYEWRMRPSDFNLCVPGEDLLLMTAYIATKADMEAYERVIAEEKALLSQANANIPRK